MGVRGFDDRVLPLHFPDVDGGERGDRYVIAVLERYKTVSDVVASCIDGLDYRAHIDKKSRHEDSP
jgi:hypothetical protein